VLIFGWYRDDTPTYYIKTGQMVEAANVLAKIYEGPFIDQMQLNASHDSRERWAGTLEDSLLTAETPEAKPKSHLKWSRMLIASFATMVGSASSGWGMMLMFFAYINDYISRPISPVITASVINTFSAI
jgi:hypothetical protein